ncbi:DEAD/DEAH box helicase domain-containing protein [Ditylenchus destructor]|nr:DEAD/DEAH box helicase domain-containing protein [Ditylenchus destructor]
MPGFFDSINSTSNVVNVDLIPVKTTKNVRNEYEDFGLSDVVIPEHPGASGEENDHINAMGDEFGDIPKDPFDGKPNFFTEQRQRNRRKFMPPQREHEDLYDERYQIRLGPKRLEQFGEQAVNEYDVSGGDGKAPIIETFDECGFSDELVNNLRMRGYEDPLPIQKCIIPMIQHKEHDIVGHAQTGTGKTAAFMLPIVDWIEQYKKKMRIDRNGGSPYAIVVAPSKELAHQLCDDARSFAECTNVSIVVSYGDMPMNESIRAINYGCDIFVGTCGRLLHFINEGCLNLEKMRFFVLDEADTLLKENLIEPILTLKSHKKLNQYHRTFMFSATMSDSVQNLTTKIVKPDHFRVIVGTINKAADTVRQTFMDVNKYKKYDELVRILTSNAKEMQRDDDTTYLSIDKTLVFVERRRRSDWLALKLAQYGFNVISINGDRTLQQRWDAREKFIKGVYQIVVATDLAARGLNFPGVSHVINFDLPEQEYLNYIHRIGRTGRAGNVGQATSFFDSQSEDDKRNAKFYVETLKSARQPVPDFLRSQAISKDRQMNEIGRKVGSFRGITQFKNDDWF